MPRMMILDTYYPEVIHDILQADSTTPPAWCYDDMLQRVMSWQFGTADWYSKHLRSFGWEVQDVIVNFWHLQEMWAQEHKVPFPALREKVLYENVLDQQINEFKPDVIFLQNLTALGPRLKDYSSRYFIAGQCSCAIRRDVLPYYRVIFTSFPHYVARYNHTQTPYARMVYNPLAFEPSILDNIPDISADSRRYDITFIGGVGQPSHWRLGMRTLELVANSFPHNFKWWGYGQDTLDPGSLLSRCYQGHAWGKDMYRIYSDSKIVLNRHGEVSQIYANNMRMYEATGCGALLLTEQKQNLCDLFREDECVPYDSPEHAVDLIAHYLDNLDEIEPIARRGQQRTLNDHTYHKRMKLISDTILEML